MSQRDSATGFDPTGYWQQRLTDKYSLGSVGWISLGEAFNRWSYAVRRRVFARAVDATFGPTDTLTVLDVGSGTGFYLQQWQRLGAKRITGCDLTPVAVDELTRRFPAANICRIDIGDEDISLPENAYDAISVVDVMYHIVDDERYARALGNLAARLKPDGALILSENLVSRSQRAEHQVTRSRAWIESTLAGAGLNIVHEYPVFFLMNTPVSSSSRLLRRWWSLLIRVVRRNDKLGWMAGAALYPVEVALSRLSVDRPSPSTRMLVCRRKLT